MTAPADHRARLGPAPSAIKEVLGPNDCDNLLKPLYDTGGGILFPYTPTITVTRSATYNDFHFSQSNFKYNQFDKSSPGELQISADWSVQTNREGQYFLAALRFLQAATMSEFGLSTPLDRRGASPPVLRFNYLGQQMFRNVPVVVSNFTYNLDKDAGYVPVVLPSTAPSGQRDDIDPNNLIRDQITVFARRPKQSKTHVPTKAILTITLLVQPNPREVRDKFSLSKFKQGKLFDRGFL